MIDCLWHQLRPHMRALALATFVCLLVSCADTKLASTENSLAPNTPPPAPREFRAAWVATVGNIDWPSKRDLTSAQQQTEIIAILDRARALNLNAIILQVRTSADAVYDSRLEPWSEYLTGEQGKAPEPYYDPLKIWVDAAHARGIELHAWFNPYRARHTLAKSPNAANHVANTMPRAVKSYGGYLWMDPGEAAASAQTLNVILDVVRRYDIDGVHIDDYFYPYPVAAPGTETPTSSPDDTPLPRAELPFPDEPSWQAYVTAGGKLTRADWRRQNVNQLIEKIYAGIKREKRHVKFGISPFGLGKPDQRPPGITGFSQYDKLYADAELWLRYGWLDYFTPQLYWPIDQREQAFGVLLDYWAKQNTQQRHLWPGLYTTRILPLDAKAKSWDPDEIINQISVVRKVGERDLANGHVHFSMVGLMENRRGIGDQLRQQLYLSPALVPASPWLGNLGNAMPPAAPEIVIARDAKRPNKITLAVKRRDAVARYAIWVRQDDAWKFDVITAGGDDDVVAESGMMFDEIAGLPEMIVWSAIDRVGTESPRVTITRAQMAAAKELVWQK